MIHHDSLKFPFENYTYDHLTIPYQDIESSDVPNVPGLYSWFVRLKPQTPEGDLDFIAKLLARTNMQATVEGGLRLRYKGQLTKEGAEAGKLSDLLHFAADAVFALPYPLYIGMSMTLRSRLIQHKNALEASVRPTPKPGRGASESCGDIESDTIEESGSFGERLGLEWAARGRIAFDILYVKAVIPVKCRDQSRCMGCDVECESTTRKELLAAEYFLNSVFNPVFGRR